MEVKIEDLEIGDEIIILGQVSKYVKILETPQVGIPFAWNNTIRFKNVRCRMKLKLTPITRNRWDPVNRVYGPKLEYDKTYILESPEDTDETKKVDLNWKRLWLVKKKLI